MKIKFIGVGSAFTIPAYYQSNLLITAQSGKKLLVDCGSDARFSLNECNDENSCGEKDPCGEIDAIYISHLHSDHIGGMEWMAFKTYFDPNREKPRLFMEKNIMYEMWESSLKGGLGCIEGKCMHLTDYFDCSPVSEDGFFLWEGICFSLIKMPHVITGYKDFYSYGILISEINPPQKGKTGGRVFFTTDTQFQPKLIADIAEKADIIFHDCETSPFKSVVHAHYDDLLSLPSDIKKKMWLYHYQPYPKVKPDEDGFKGFVIKGQEFDL